MECLARLARYIRGKPKRLPFVKIASVDNNECPRDLLVFMESVIMWESFVRSMSIVLVFNVLFWGFVIFEVRGFTAVSSAAIIAMLCYRIQVAEKFCKEEEDNQIQAKAEQIKKILEKAKSMVCCLQRMREEQPGVFCSVVCSVSFGLWLLGRGVNGVLLTYTLCMSVLIGPVIFMQLSNKTLSHTEWDSEMEDFCPAVTKDGLHILNCASDITQHCPVSTSAESDLLHESVSENDLLGMKMPSHEGSVDGEINIADVMRLQAGNFENSSSSSEEESELAEFKKLIMQRVSDDSDSEFEIIDGGEFANMKNR